MPKEEMPARRGCPLGSQARSSVNSSTFPVVQSTLVDEDAGQQGDEVSGARPLTCSLQDL